VDEIAHSIPSATLTEICTRGVTLAKMDEAYAAEAKLRSASVAGGKRVTIREKQPPGIRLKPAEKSRKRWFSQIDLLKIPARSCWVRKRSSGAQRTLEQVSRGGTKWKTRNRANERSNPAKREIANELGAFVKGDLENSTAEPANDSRTLRRRHSFSRAAQCRQRCDKARTELCQSDGRRRNRSAFDLKRVVWRS